MSAVFSTCGNYRFILYRQWWVGPGSVLFIMLNPSTADHRRNDPTIRACVSFAKLWGFPGLAVVNVCALRATNPAQLYRHPAPIDLELGEYNDYWIRSAVESADLVVCAWGNHAAKLHREHHVPEDHLPRWSHSYSVAHQPGDGSPCSSPVSSEDAQSD